MTPTAAHVIGVDIGTQSTKAVVIDGAGHIVAQAARQLGISRQALYRRMEKLGIKESPGR